jgi:S1-C subfamily serine protease
MRGVAGIVGTIAVAASSVAMAENWVQVGKDQNDAKFYVEADSVAQTGEMVLSWVKQENKSDTFDAGHQKNFRYTVARHTIDCRNNRDMQSATFAYDAAGNIQFSSGSGGDDAAWVSISPGTVGTLVETRVCTLVFPERYLTSHVFANLPSSGAWHVISTSSDSSVEYGINDSSIKSIKGGYAIFAEREYSKPTILNRDGSKYNFEYSLFVANCLPGEMGEVAVDDYSESGRLVYTESIDVKNIKLSAMPPGSVGEAAIKYACSNSAAGKPDDTKGSGTGSVSSGTAWMAPKGYLVTASHVVHAATALTLLQDGKQVGTAIVVADDPANDVAILRPTLKDGRHIAIPIAESPARLGERIFTLGYPVPDKLGVSLKVTSGEVSSLAGNDVDSQRTDDIRLMQVSAPIQSGNSGGPLIDDNGYVVGIVISKQQMATADEIAENINYSLKISYVRSILDELPDIGGYQSAKSSTGREDIVSSIRNGVFLIVATSALP